LEISSNLVRRDNERVQDLDAHVSKTFVVAEEAEPEDVLDDAEEADLVVVVRRRGLSESESGPESIE
jgi:hypothetical protein